MAGRGCCGGGSGFNADACGLHNSYLPLAPGQWIFPQELSSEIEQSLRVPHPPAVRAHYTRVTVPIRPLRRRPFFDLYPPRAQTLVCVQHRRCCVRAILVMVIIITRLQRALLYIFATFNNENCFLYTLILCSCIIYIWKRLSKRTDDNACV